MAATLTITHSDLQVTKPAPTGLGLVIGTLNLGTYATNGVAIDPDNIRDGLTLLNVFCGVSVDGTTLYSYNPSTEKVRAWTVSGDPGALAEVSNSADLSGAGKHCVCLVAYREGTKANVPSTNPVTL